MFVHKYILFIINDNLYLYLVLLCLSLSTRNTFVYIDFVIVKMYSTKHYWLLICLEYYLLTHFLF